MEPGSTTPDLPPPNALDPTEIPPFVEALDQDPFGQNPRLVDEAWAQVARYLCGLVEVAHSAGVALTLPKAPPGFLFLSGQEWRRFCGVTSSAPQEWEALLPPDPAYAPELGTSLDVVQRCLTTLAALAATDDDSAWMQTAVALQSLGYLLIASHVRIERIPAFERYVDIGGFTARSHRLNTLHGDLHPGNFARFENTFITFDTETVRTLSRPLTPIECAVDLALLRFHCSFSQWEAVKAGYAAGAPELALQVFEFL